MGTRFALLELKLFLISLLKTFIVLKGDMTENTFRIIELTVIGPEKVLIKLKRRTPSM
jgi:hypothetical protein